MNLGKIREIRENFSSRKFVHLWYMCYHHWVKKADKQNF